MYLESAEYPVQEGEEGCAKDKVQEMKEGAVPATVDRLGVACDACVCK